MALGLTDVATHYGFGENWKDYAKKIDEEAIRVAEDGLLQLIPREEIMGRSFLDIGCGSGLHCLAALRLGAARVVAVDIDADSVETTRATLKRNWAGTNVDVQLLSILDDRALDLGEFDIVYSWGVLHHTGSMWEAIQRAADHVKHDGKFVLAIYRKTPLCWAWKIEKKLFTNSGNFVRSFLRRAYISIFKLGLRINGQDPAEYINGYKTRRGMNFYNDVDDWLGGYPYESATEGEISAFMTARGFVDELVINCPPRAGGALGTGCAEFRFRRVG